jgi:hypothetical protein
MPTLRYNSVNGVIIEAAMQVLSTRKPLHGRIYNNTVRALYLSFGILLLCRKHLHGRFYNNTVHAVIFECWHITPI